MPAPITTEVRVPCRADVCSLWDAMTDTERMNRAVGMERVRFTPLDGPTAARYLATTRLGGFSVAYEEQPYEWEYLKYFRVYRKMRGGPARGLGVEYLFEKGREGETVICVRLTVEPRLALLAPVARASSRGTLRRFERAIRRLDEALAAGKSIAVDDNVKSAAAAAALARASQALAAAVAGNAAREQAAARLVEYVRTATDFELSRLRPYPLADAWGLPRREVLVTCLESVGAGLLDLRWDLVCPSCRTAAASVPSLSEIEGHARCQLCDVRFGLEIDEAVEATFQPSEAVRRVDRGPYCIGGPARTPHVLAQAVLPSGGAATLTAPTAAGAYRLFVRGGRSLRLDVAADGAPSLALAADEAAGWPARAPVAPGAELRVTRRDPGDVHVKLERLDWVRDGATARDVTALPIFRRRFSSDLLRRDVALQVSRVALFFSDLTDSTKLYATAGDAAAFRLVQDHFGVLVRLIGEHGGTLVKTIGDAVMAAFADDVDAVRAGVAILEAFAAFRATAPHGDRTDVKLGVYAGPCYVVTANGILDYFGQTVNLAARLQGTARSGELVVTRELADEARARGVLAGATASAPESVALKGVDGPVEIVRLRRAG
jgi:class 3 adenylate cyclase